MEQEKRQFSRVLFEAPVLLLWEDNSWPSTLIDISLNGLLIKKPENWDSSMFGEFLDIEITLEDASQNIRMQAHVAHEHSDRVGFQCDYIDLDSMSNLKRLVEFNTGDETILERELERLLT